MFAAALAAGLIAFTGAGASAQTYDPSTGDTPDVLLAAPRDGVAYFRMRQEAQRLFDAKKFAEAEPLARQLVRDYPRDPANWNLLGRTLRALDKHAEALAAFGQAGPLIGWTFFNAPNGYRVAIEALKAGERKGALAALRAVIFVEHGRARGELYDSPDFAALRDDPEFREIVGRPDTKGWTRDEGWRRDLDLLYAEIKRSNPDYRDKPFPAEFERRYRNLKANVAKLSDEQLYFGVQRMLAPLHQGHVFAGYLPGGRFLPLWLYAFPEGIFVIGGSDEHKDLVGARVVSLGSLSAEEALRRLADAKSVDGDMEYLWQASRLADAASLQGMGAVKNQDAIPLVLQTRAGKRLSVTMATVTTPPPNEQNKRWDRLGPPPAGVTPPLFLSHMLDVFWQQPAPEHDALYVQLNNVMGAPDEPLMDYGKRLWTILEQQRPANLVLDLRHNNGGDSTTYTELLRTIVAFSRDPGHKVYVLIGRRTYSAAANLVTDLERLVRPVFVGEATSECCNLYGDPSGVTLPYSKLELEVTALKWQLSYPGDERREISPDMPIQFTAADYFAGRDPALDAVWRVIDADRKGAGAYDRPKPPSRRSAPVVLHGSRAV
jgi:hypothetical protein